MASLIARSFLIFYKVGKGISYSNVVFLRDIWTMHDLEQCFVCSDEINEGEPSISIIDMMTFQMTH